MNEQKLKLFKKDEKKLEWVAKAISRSTSDPEFVRSIIKSQLWRMATRHPELNEAINFVSLHKEGDIPKEERLSADVIAIMWLLQVAGLTLLSSERMVETTESVVKTTEEDTLEDEADEADEADEILRQIRARKSKRDEATPEEVTG